MHRHAAYLLSIAALLTLLTLFRHHLRDLAELTRTYATFHPFIKRHPEVLYRYPNPTREDGLKNDQDLLVPPILHNIFLTENNHTASLGKYEAAIESCRALHSNWTHFLWTDAIAADFMEQHHPDIFPHYRAYKQSIQRANVLRYALLNHFGGVYVDLDVSCLRPLDDLRSLPWLTPGAYPAGVNNAFILSRPHHPILEQLLTKVPSHDLPWGSPYVENMLSTGCMFFSNCWISYARYFTKQLKRGLANPKENRIYVLADENGGLDTHMLRGAVTTPLFKHGGASTWHSWDAAIILFLGKHYRYAIMTIALLSAIILVFVGWRLLRKFSRKRRSWTSAKRGRICTPRAVNEEWELGVMNETERRVS